MRTRIAALATALVTAAPLTLAVPCRRHPPQARTPGPASPSLGGPPMPTSGADAGGGDGRRRLDGDRQRGDLPTSSVHRPLRRKCADLPVRARGLRPSSSSSTATTRPSPPGTRRRRPGRGWRRCSAAGTPTAPGPSGTSWAGGPPAATTPPATSTGPRSTVRATPTARILTDTFASRKGASRWPSRPGCGLLRPAGAATARDSTPSRPWRASYPRSTRRPARSPLLGRSSCR